MKRIISAVLLLCLLLAGCTTGQERLKEPVTFYYPRIHGQTESYEAFFSNGAIGSEIREASGHRQDLNYLISMYLQGPTDSQLESLFPAGCYLIGALYEKDTLTVSLNSAAGSMNEMDITVAFACLAKTCMELTGATTVQITSVDGALSVLHTRTFTAENLLLTDNAAQPTDPSQ